VKYNPHVLKSGLLGLDTFLGLSRNGLSLLFLMSELSVDYEQAALPLRHGEKRIEQPQGRSSG
jgi:hypothetical protein